MKIQFIGTGAADWVLTERKENEFFRRLTAVKIDNELMIDCSLDTMDFVKGNKDALNGVKDIVITHTHSDHYSQTAISKLFGNSVRVWAEQEAEKMILNDMPMLKEGVLEMFKENIVGKYSVIPVPANHSVADKKQTPVHYIISKDDKTIFWGCDGAWIPNYSWHEVTKHKYDAFVLDGTLGNGYGDYRIFEHNNIAMIREMAGTIRSQELLKDNGKIIISHMSRYAHDEHDVLQKQLEEYGILVAYDEMEIEF